MGLTAEETAWVDEARAQQDGLRRRAEEKASLERLRGEAEAGREMGERAASGAFRRLGIAPADVPEPSDSDVQRQSDVGREAARRINARYSSRPAGENR